jgi:hypothetical protein
MRSRSSEITRSVAPCAFADLNQNRGFQFAQMRVCSFFVLYRCLGLILMFSTKSASQRPTTVTCETIRTENENPSGLRSAGTHELRKYSLADGIILRQLRCRVLTVTCRTCRRSDEMDRQAVVKRHGATIPMRTLRRRMGLGCERMNAADGVDRCQLTISAKTKEG